MNDFTNLIARIDRQRLTRMRERLGMDGLALRKTRSHSAASDAATYVIVNTYSDTVVAGRGEIIDTISGHGMIIDKVAKDLESIIDEIFVSLGCSHTS